MINLTNTCVNKVVFYNIDNLFFVKAMSPGSFYNGVNKKWGNIKSFQKLYTVFSAKEKENFLSLKPEEMLRFARENECDTNIEEIGSLLNSKTPFVNELSEEELSSVSGGAIRISTDNTYYKFTGNYNKESDHNNMYLCPQCGRTVHWGSWLRWYCVTCNTSWYDESKLLPNLESRLWNIIPNNLDNRSFDDFKLNPLG